MTKDTEPEAPGLRCPKCWCADLRVYYTRKRRRQILRVRICRHCGTHVRTYERVSDAQK